MKIKILIIIIVIMLLLPISCLCLTYDGCDSSTISRNKSLISNINVYYDYYMDGSNPKFSVTLTNIPNNVHFRDTLTDKIYYSSDADQGEITITDYIGNSGSYKFYYHDNKCDNIYVGVKYYNFPSYNKYYSDELCKGYEYLNLCKKWAKINYNYDEFKKKINEYKNSTSDIKDDIIVEYEKSFFDKLIDIYAKYYYYFLLGIIFFCTIIFIVYKRKNKFDL